MRAKQGRAILLALLAAVLYAVSTPASKLLLAYIGPTMLAACLYFGAGLGVGAVFLLRRKPVEKGTALGRSDLPYTVGMIVLDIAAPILLMNGIRLTAAANVSLLNNFEIVATALIAFLAFHEKISPGMWAALLLITLASAVLSFEGTSSLRFSAGSLMVVGASLCWGLENNCTREISSKSTYEIVILKGLCSGAGSFVIALAAGEKLPPPRAAVCALALGFTAYGLSIFAYIRAQNVIGAAKTSAFYALTPFLGALLSHIFLREALSPLYSIGLLLMTAGSFLAVSDTLKYRHCHMHSHTVYHLRGGRIQEETVTHEHEHSHLGPGLAHVHLHLGT